MILNFVLALVLAQSVAAPPPELTGVLDSHLTASTPSVVDFCNEATAEDRSLLPKDLAGERHVWSCTMLCIAPIGQRHALFIERRWRQPLLLLDDDDDGRFDARERHEFPKQGDLQVRIPIAGRMFPEYPIAIRYRWELFKSRAFPARRALLESPTASVAGTVTIGGRPVRVEYPLFADLTPSIASDWFRIDANGDGRIDDDPLSDESVPPSSELPVVRVGNRYVSTVSIDPDTRVVKLREHPAADYHRIVLRVGEQVPDFTYRDISTHAPLGLSDIHSRLLLLVVWSPSCPPALEELPRIEEAFRTFTGKGLAVLGLPDHADRKDIASVVSRFQLTWSNADPDSVKGLLKDRWQITSIPQLILVDGNRRILAISRNGDTSLRGARLRKTVQQRLRESR